MLLKRRSKPTTSRLPRERPARIATIAPAALLIVCALGAAISALSTRDHVRFRVSGGTQAGACAALVDSGCKAAHSSAVAELFGVPISHFGTAFYLAGASLAVLAWVLRRRRAHARPAADGVPLVVGLMGLGAVAYSVFLASVLIRSGEACPFCIVLYAVNAALLLLGTLWWRRGERTFDLRPLVAPLLVAGLVGGGFMAATTPLLVRALSKTPPWIAAAAADSDGRMQVPLSLPDRLPSKGAPDADDDLIEFSDLECPHCSSLHRTVEALFEERGAAHLRVRFVNYPLDQACNPYVARTLHPTACLSARGGLCAQQQDRFWLFVDEYLQLDEPRSRTLILDTARKLGLDIQRFSECLDAESTTRVLADDVALAHAAAVRATPTVVVNGWSFQGAIPREQLVQIMNDTTPCGCDRRSTDGTCGAATDQASPSESEQH